MKYVGLLFFILFVADLLFSQGSFSQTSFSQGSRRPEITGLWRARKVVPFQEAPYDLDQKDASYALFMMRAKEKSQGDSLWRHRDSANMVMQFRYAMERLEKKRLELRQDKTYLSEGLLPGNDTAGDVHRGTYRYEARQSALELLDNKGQTEASFIATFLNDSTLVLTGSGRSRMIPVMTYRRVR